MKKIILTLSLFLVSSATFAFNGVCIYADNKVAQGKPNGSILIVPVNVADNESVDLVTLDMSSNILRAKLAVSGNTKYLIVSDAKGNILQNKPSAMDSGASFLLSVRTGVFESAQASIVCVPR